MIVDDPPPLGKFLEDESEDSPDIAGLALQVPAAEHECRIWPEWPNLKLGKIQLAHRRRRMSVPANSSSRP